MEDQYLHQWIENFDSEMESIKISFDAFFIKDSINKYYSLKIDNDDEKLILEITNGDELPNEILNRIRDAYEKSKPSV